MPFTKFTFTGDDYSSRTFTNEMEYVESHLSKHIPGFYKLEGKTKSQDKRIMFRVRLLKNVGAEMCAHIKRNAHAIIKVFQKEQNGNLILVVLVSVDKLIEIVEIQQQYTCGVVFDHLFITNLNEPSASEGTRKRKRDQDGEGKPHKRLRFTSEPIGLSLEDVEMSTIYAFSKLLNTNKNLPAQDQLVASYRKFMVYLERIQSLMHAGEFPMPLSVLDIQVPVISRLSDIQLADRKCGCTWLFQIAIKCIAEHSWDQCHVESFAPWRETFLKNAMMIRPKFTKVDIETILPALDVVSKFVWGAIKNSHSVAFANVYKEANISLSE